MVPPDMMGQEYDEEYLIKKDFEERRDPRKDYMDHKDDITCFEISIVNRKNMAVNIDCTVNSGDIIFGKVRVFDQDGLEVVKQSWSERGGKKL